MHHYRLYILNKEGHLIGPGLLIEAEADEAAIAEAIKRFDGVAAELWEEARLVRKFPPTK